MSCEEKKSLTEYIKTIFYSKVRFPGSKKYWKRRYRKGGTSGNGSYGEKAEFKANIINNFIEKNNIQSVIEFGCGDGNQLSYGNYPEYIGLDVSKNALKRCQENFKDDKTKSFFLYDPNHFVDNTHVFKSELGLSLDVLYHLIEDDIFEKHLEHLFSSSKDYVIIYSTNYDERTANHVKHREFLPYVKNNFEEWTMNNKIRNKYEDANSDFYIFEKK
jgi:SAM-dependent methyltransferase